MKHPLPRGWFACAILVTTAACAQPYPQRPVRMIVPFAAGGTTDIIARSVTTRLSALWGQQVVIDNRPGAGTLIGAELMTSAAPDGHTLLMMGTSTLILTGADATGRKPRIDLERDFAPVILCATGANILAVRAAAPWKTLKDVIAAAKAKPNTLSYGSAGMASSPHLTGELFAQMAGIQLVHVPYKGNTPSIADAIGGQIDMVFAASPALLPFFKAGRLRGIAIGAKQRFSLLPDLPTFDEAGLPGYDLPNFFGFTTSAGTPRALIAKINRDSDAQLKHPDVTQIMINDGLTPGGGSPEDFLRFLRDRRAQLMGLVKAANIRLQ